METLIAAAGDTLRTRELARVAFRDVQIPIKACYLGSASGRVPVLAFIGGVHGLERIGSQVVLTFLESLVQRLSWDSSLVAGLRNLRLVFIPIVNPVGIIRNTRCNGVGVDLMRNAPIEADTRVPFLVGGQRISPMLPWYRGRRRDDMQPEALALVNAISAELRQSPFTVALDVHSGYGFQDRLWFPLACSRTPIEHLPEVYSLFRVLEKTYPNLDYLVEPQSCQYLTHGDLWDYLYLQAVVNRQLLIPLTLEMGSWNWVRKNWRQTRSIFGWFNPVKPHRVQRVLRRHTVLLEFLIRAVRSYENWLPPAVERDNIDRQARQKWYDR